MSVDSTSKTETKMTIDSQGAYTVIARMSEWDLMQSIPGAITRHIVEAIAERFILEHGDVLMRSLMKPEFIQTALPKAIEHHLQEYFGKKRKEEEERKRRP